MEEFELTLTRDEIKEFYKTLIKYKDDEEATIRYINAFICKIENRLTNSRN